MIEGTTAEGVLGSFGIHARVTGRRDDAVTVSLTVPPDWGYLRGHFPRFPVVPGMLIVDMVHRVALTELGVESELAEVVAVRFSAPAMAGQEIEIECTRPTGDAVVSTARIDGTEIGVVELSYGEGGTP